MPLRPDPLTIDEGAPFAQDRLQRKQSADFLTGLLADSPEGFVLGLNAPWGQGKTTFLTMWRHELTRLGATCILLNAWESDFVNDPLVALLGEMESALSLIGKKSAQKQSLSKRIAKLKRLGSAIARSAIPVAVKIGTSGVLDLDAATEEALAGAAGDFASKQIDEYLETRKSIDRYRNELAELALQCRAKLEDGREYPIVFLIDELDRCRPNFSMEMLECIKHLFTVRGVVFVIATDVEQLKHSVRHLYGAGMDAGGYLRRFFDLELSLPTTSMDAFFRQQFSRFKVEDAINRRTESSGQSSQIDGVFEVLSALLAAYEASLRDAERVFALLYLAITATPSRHHLYPHLLAAMSTIKVIDNDCYMEIKKGDFDVKKWVEKIGVKSSGKRLLQSDVGRILEGQLYAATQGDIQRVMKKYRWDLENGVSDEVKVRASQILQYFDFPEMRASADALRPLLARLDLVASHGAG